ncbi:two-component system, chemotaxis family, sensor kinase CheA [Malonomonas rubra DSM 5091]|uniref:Chemotaxis protein CheA n=1 Tax=Malonomonas rubra DSM 5091 TaxID=1122189 RepID=A0A1M6JY37_MALRU|nr:chemotaxis protein CheA [Malonomonas rubra]SHJ51538.1 two-component system, chemotaxis family, sensor kinase CheA [Malonomonas rubra DSM 5091]
MDIEKYRKMFLSEAGEHLEKMAEQLVAVEADPQNSDGIDALFREAHSIKGMAATMGYDATARVSHRLEDELQNCREQGEVDSEMIDRLLTGVDLLESLLEDISEGRAERSVDDFINGVMLVEELEPIPEEDSCDLAGEGVLVRLRLADSVAAPGPRLLVLLTRMAEFGTVLEAKPSEEQLLQGEISRILLVRLATEASQEEIRQRLQCYRELNAIEFPVAVLEKDQQRKVSRKSGTTVRVDTDLLDRFINLTGELLTNRYQLQSAAGERNWREMNEGLSQLARLVKNLHHQVLQVRMMPLESITGRLPRAVRDLCRSSGKEVEFSVEGASIELDRAILEELADPLTHMIRNAIDHGIEQTGSVQIKSWRERDQVLIQVADDGRGIDPEKVRKRAIERNLISPAQAQVMRDYDVLQLICQPGFSTAEQVTETSGRGVGMDVVKTSVEKLGGVLLIDSTPGEGTRISLKLPLSVAIIRVLMIECAGCLLGIPITRVLQTVEISPKEVQTSGKQLVISLHGELLPLLSLRKILRQPKGPASNLLSLVVTEVFGRKVGLVIDRLVGQQEVFVQPLPSPFDRLRGNSGGAILGDGRILFLIDLQSMLEKRRTKGS